MIAKAEEFGDVVSWTEDSAKEIDELVGNIQTSLVNKTSERFERSKKVIPEFFILEHNIEILTRKPFLSLQSKDVVSALQDKTAVLLAAHMARVKPEKESLARGTILNFCRLRPKQRLKIIASFAEQSEVVLKSVNLVNGLLQIALSRSWLNMVLASIDVSQVWALLQAARKLSTNKCKAPCPRSLFPTNASLSAATHDSRPP